MASKYVAVVLAVWLTWAALGGLSASALPDKVVVGEVFGPGGDMDPGATNPANFGDAVFYSTTNVSYAVLVGADSWNLASTTAPANFARNVGTVGSGWDWWVGANVVAVVETIRGVNAWSGVNYTTSLDATMDANGLQAISTGELAALPTLTLTPVGSTIDVTWSPIADANGNVVSYELYHNAVQEATVAQGPTPSYSDTGLSTGGHCYELAVNYRRDAAGGVYETTGRSEPVCATVTGPAPWIVSTNPTNGALGVLLNQDIVVTFSEPIVLGSLLFTINPFVALTPSGSTVMTFTHPDFTACLTYTMEITQARDVDVNDLIDSPPPVTPNPWSFTALCLSPYVTTTVPTSGAAQVRAGAAVVVTFSENMATATVQFSPNPAPSCNAPPLTVMTCTANFVPGVTYTAWANGTDVDNNAVVPGPVPNPFTFTINVPPTASFLTPGSGECHTGGSQLFIGWTMSDPETSLGSLRVSLDYTYNTVTTSILADQTGFNSPANFGWTLPTIDGTIDLALEVKDQAGETATQFSAAVTVDSTAPSVVLPTSPANGATGVATNINIRITFSEAMDTVATQAAFQISPIVASREYGWSGTAGNPILTIYHNATPFTPNQLYTISFGVGAVDDCDPGMPLSPSFSHTFTTGAGAKSPNPPTGLAPGATTSAAIPLTWTAPTLYTDSTPITSALTYRVYRSGSQGGPYTEVTTTPVLVTAFTDTGVAAGQTYWYQVTAVDPDFGESLPSAPAQATASSAPGPGFDWLVVLIPVIVILVVVGLFLLLRKKKPAEAPPRPEAAPGVPGETAPAPPEEGIAGPAGETAAEGGEKFIPCPNCGTMVKPTDAECFVCGAKL